MASLGPITGIIMATGISSGLPSFDFSQRPAEITPWNPGITTGLDWDRRSYHPNKCQIILARIQNYLYNYSFFYNFSFIGGMPSHDKSYSFSYTKGVFNMFKGAQFHHTIKAGSMFVLAPMYISICISIGSTHPSLLYLWILTDSSDYHSTIRGQLT